MAREKNEEFENVLEEELNNSVEPLLLKRVK